MPGHDIIVIGTSAGGVEALVELVKSLPRGLPASIFVVLHIPPHSLSALPDILSRAGPLPARHPSDEEAIVPGRIYIAPPDHHLLLERDQMRVIRGPRENRHRPAIDPLFRSAALTYGSRVAGVILTGALDDGTAGLLAVKRQGGLTIVQNPDEALFPDMPRSALAHVDVEYVLPLAAIGPLLTRIVRQRDGGAPLTGILPSATLSPDTLPVDVLPANTMHVDASPKDMHTEIGIVEMNMPHDTQPPGAPSAFSCPECGGVLWEIYDEHLLRFRCQIGHSFSVESMLAEQSDTLEKTLWAALKILDERIELSCHMIKQARDRNQARLVQYFQRNMQETEQHASLIRQILL
ncbi:MAG: chemotaxis protein CheB [Ktedonobacteraceae bacterium]|nr:chemotaxis protein CheB [Ktedonobacteraceae bacterium]